MSELLTNDEIESLMELVAAAQHAELDGPDMAEFGAVPEGRRSSVGPVDLLTPNRMSSTVLAHLRRMFEGSATVIGDMMSDQLRYPIHCDCVAVDQTRFADWVPMAADNAAVYVLNAPPLEIPLLFSMSKELFYGWVDRVLGGRGQVSELPASFSEAEFAIADSFLGPIFTGLANSMSDLAPLRIGIEDRFTNGARLRLLPSQNVVLAVHFQAGSDLLLGDLYLGIAFSSIEPYLDGLVADPDRFAFAPGAMRRILSGAVQPVDVDVSIELGSAEMTLRNLMSMQVGDVIRLDQRVGDPMIAPVGEVPKFAGRVGRVGGKLGFRIETILE